MNLSKHTIQELRYKLDTAKDEVSLGCHDDDIWEVTVRDIEAVLANPTVATLKANPEALVELEDAVVILQDQYDVGDTKDRREIGKVLRAVEADLEQVNV